MKAKLITLTILVLSAIIVNPLYGQQTFTNYAHIDGNNINARIYSGGDLFWDLQGAPKFEVPKDSGTHTVFAAAPWISGWDNDSNLYVAAQTYRQSGIDFWPGPLSTEDASTTYQVAEEWDKVWKVTREDIETFLQTGQATDDMLSWPAHGNSDHGQAENLAPFVDVSGNGTYEPENGDYPLINGDVTLWWVFNDNLDEHTETRGNRMGIEIQGMAYAFESDNEIINNSLFFEYSIINRSDIHYQDVYMGKFVDFDIGYSLNDYIGSFPENNTFYGYSGEDVDPGETGYGENPPAQSMTFLNHDLAYFISYYHNFTTYGHPSQPEHYYNYLTGRWKDGSPICFGGDGGANCWKPDSAVKYMNPHDPNLPRDNDDYWSDESAENAIRDVRGVGSIGPFDFGPGETIEIRAGYTFHHGGTRLENVQRIPDDINTLKSFYENEVLTSLPHESKTQLKPELYLYPNPVNAEKTLHIHTPESQISQITISNLAGRQVKHIEKIGSSKAEVNLPALEDGIYLVNIQTTNNRITKKVLVNSHP